VWKRTEERPAARGAFVLASAGLAAFLGYIWWPNGEYRPIQPGEKGTIQGAVRQFEEISSGRPSLPPERERELGGAPLLSSEERPEPRREEGRTPTVSTPTTTDETPTTTAETTTTQTTTTSETTQTTTTSTP
jgi:hypothetical protein